VTLDLIPVIIDLASIAVLLFVVFVACSAVRSFRQSKQAVAESASLLSVIVSALTSRVQASESVARDLGMRFEMFHQRTSHLESEQSNFRASYLQVLQYLQEVLTNDKRLIFELEQVKTKLGALEQPRIAARELVTRVQAASLPIGKDNMLAALTPTEREILIILQREGGMSAPELGRRMKKSREHMARLMKRLYLDGYVDKESNHAPFRYKLNVKVGTILSNGASSATAEVREET